MAGARDGATSSITYEETAVPTATAFPNPSTLELIVNLCHKYSQAAVPRAKMNSFINAMHINLALKAL